ncbi:MAG: hypothetical protein ACLQPD_02210 [Desulfomonilaceae bacterium]
MFFTSFTPSTTVATDVCQAGGTGYLYALDYECQAFPAGFSPFTDATVIAEQFGITSGGTTYSYGAKVNLGSGVPSQPILDPTGNHIIIQESTAKLQSVSVNLLDKSNQVQGWRKAPSN